MSEKIDRNSSRQKRPLIEPGYFASLFEMVPEALVIVDNDGLVLQINGEFSRIFGYSAKEAIGAVLDDLVAPPDLIDEARRISSAAQAGERFALETRRRRKSGEIFCASVIGAPILSGGRQVGCFGIYRDISDRKNAEEALQREKAFLEQLIESAQEAVAITDPYGRVQRINGEFTRLFGWEPEEALGRALDDLVVPDELRDEGTWISRMVVDERMHIVETVRQRKDGSRIPVSLLGSAIEVGGRVEALYAIYRDISAQKTAERALTESEKRYRGFFENVPVGIFQTTPEGRYINANAAHLQIFGFPNLATLRGMNAADFYSTPEEREKWKEQMNRDNVMRAQDFHFRRGDGRMIWTRESARTVRDQEGKVLYYEGIVEDITALKEAEQAFQREKVFLEQLIENAPEAIILTDSKGIVLRVNSEFEKIFGYTIEETMGHQIDDLVAPPGTLRDEAEKITTGIARGHKFSLETVRRCKNGDLIHVSLIGSPIMLGNEQVGVYGIYRDISDRKKAEEALQERTKQLEEANSLLEQISNLDGLTSIPNRRYFEHFYDIEWRRARRENKEISVIMIDVDFFKDYNDRYGHPAGDECLKKIAKTLQVANRAGDVLARYGGEEFVAVLPSTGMAGALHLARMMQRRVKELDIEHETSPLGRRVTISLGIATVIPDRNSDPLALMTMADQSLYQAKIKGRDRIEGSGV